jgi:hypothetical protein
VPCGGRFSVSCINVTEIVSDFNWKAGTVHLVGVHVEFALTLFAAKTEVVARGTGLDRHRDRFKLARTCSSELLGHRMHSLH